MISKRLVTLVAVCFTAFNLVAQQLEQIKIPRINSSSLLLVQDSSKISASIAEKVTSKLGMRTRHRHNFAIEYRGKTGYGQSYTAAFVVWPLEVQKRYEIELQEKLIELEPFEQYYVYGFSSNLNEGKRADKNFSEVLLSAYRQEADTAYGKNQDEFTTLKRIDKAEFRKRNWLNMGYGVSYIVKDNPFAGSKKLNIGFAHFWEAVHYIPIIGGPFFGETRQDKIGIPLVGLASLVVWKGVIMPVLVNSNIKLNNKVVDSGYKVPKNLKY